MPAYYGQHQYTPNLIYIKLYLILVSYKPDRETLMSVALLKYFRQTRNVAESVQHWPCMHSGPV